VNPSTPLPPTDYLALVVVVFLAGFTAVIILTFLLHFFDAAGRRRIASVWVYLRAFAFEWWYSLAVVLAHPLGWLPRFGSWRYDPTGGPPILLTHGFLMNRACLFAVYWRLRRRGYRNVYPVNMWPPLGSIETTGQRLAETIRAISAMAGGRELCCVAHSMGGVVLRWCVQNDPALPVQKLVTIGSPHNGTRSAYLSPGANAAQMRPDSTLLARLDAEPRVPLASIYSDLDNLVIPSESSAFGHVQLELPGCGHMTLMFDPRVFEWIAAEVPEMSAA